MSSSLVEMVVAISILGLIMTGLIVTTTKTIVTYQAADAQVEESTAHTMAAARAARIVDRVWRDADPPAGYGDLSLADASEIRIGDWRLRASAAQMQQARGGPQYQPLTDNVSSFAFSYRLGNGAWVSQTLDNDQRAAVVAVKHGWVDAITGRKFGGIVVLPDRQFSGGNISLPAPDTQQAYVRSNYAQQITLSLGSWP